MLAVSVYEGLTTRYLFASFDTFPEMTFGKEGRGGGSHNLEVPEMAARTTFIEQ